MRKLKKILLLLILLTSTLFIFGQTNTIYAQHTQSKNTTEKGINANTITTPVKSEGKQKETCEGIKLNTNVPFIGRCIQVKKEGEKTKAGDVTQLTAFPFLMGGLTKITVTLILSVSFLMIIVAGVMMVAGGAKQEYYKKGLGIIKTVIIALAVLGSSGIILKLINPNFFGI